MRPIRYSSVLCAMLAFGLSFSAQAQVYGTGVVQDVPYVAPGTITTDGNGNEAAWATAPEVSLIANWDGAWSGHPDPDIAASAKLLFSDGVLYILARFEDYQDFWFTPGDGDHMLVGIDPVHEAGVTDLLTDPSFSGWADFGHQPDLGPYAYKIWAGNDTIPALSVNFSPDYAPADSGWVAGNVTVDNSTFTWGFEMAIYAPQIMPAGEIGFNIGGATGDPNNTDDGAYAYFAWQVCDNPGPDNSCQYAGGNVMSDAGSFATLRLLGTSSAEGGTAVPGYALRPNTPNPFAGTTALTYELPAASEMELAAYDVLGRKVVVLDAGARAAGAHRASFDARGLPAGVYTLRLSVDGAVVATRRVLQTR